MGHISKSLKTPSASLVFTPEVLEFAQGIGRVELFSSTTMVLLRELSQGNLSTKQLGVKISQDPTLSASLLKLANSAYYGIPNRVSTVGHAVTLLGFTAVRNLVQGLCLVEFDQPDAGAKQDPQARSFGAHSMAVSKMAGVLTKKFGFPSLGQGEAETAGLLHDIGFLLMSVTRKEDFAKLVEAFREHRGDSSGGHAEGSRLLDLERKTFGFTHPELGAWLAQSWNLPPMIQEALMHHHVDISDCLHRESVTVVQLANLICNENEMGYLPEGFWGDVDPSILRFLESQNKLGVYESFPHSLEKEIKAVKVLYEYVATGMKKESQPPSEVDREAAKPSRKPATPEGSDRELEWDWSMLAPGLPQYLAGRKEEGVLLMMLFVLAVFIGGFALFSGNLIVGIGALVAAGASWTFSILST